MKNKLLKLVLFLIVLILSVVLTKKLTTKIEIHNIEKINQETIEKVENLEPTNPSEILEPTEQNTSYLNVPFICQAPLETEENWTLHEESCEEAALLQAYLYETGKTITKEEANEIILDMIAWQEGYFGEHKDLYAEDMKTFINQYYQIPEENIKIINNATIEILKEQVNQGHPVIVPITGEILQNPFYPYPGYHMLTVIGYTEDRIITNDNGTRRGKDFSYDQEIFEQAMQDAGGDIIILDLNKN